VFDCAIRGFSKLYDILVEREARGKDKFMILNYVIPFTQCNQF